MDFPKHFTLRLEATVPADGTGLSPTCSFPQIHTTFSRVSRATKAFKGRREHNCLKSKENSANGLSEQVPTTVCSIPSYIFQLSRLLHFGKGSCSHSSVLAWRIPGTGEPGGLPSMGSHRVGHDGSDLAAAKAAVYLWHLSSSRSSSVKNNLQSRKMGAHQ